MKIKSRRYRLFFFFFFEIQTIYNPINQSFAKDNIRKVSEELQYFQSGERDSGKIILEGINGFDYEVSVKARCDLPRGNEHLEARIR